MNKIKVIYLHDGLVQMLFNDNLPVHWYGHIHSVAQAGAGLSVKDHGAAIHDSIIVAKDEYMRFREAPAFKDWFDETDYCQQKILVNITDDTVQAVIASHPNTRVVIVMAVGNPFGPEIHDFNHPDTHNGHFSELYRGGEPNEADLDKTARHYVLDHLVKIDF